MGSTTNNTNEIVTVAGLKKEYHIDVFRITSNQIQEYLQENINYLAKGLDEGKGYHLGTVPIAFSADEIRKFVLFSVTFPENAIDRGNRDDYMRMYVNSNSTNLLRPFYDFIKVFMYTKEQKDDFRSPAIKKEYGFIEKEHATICKMMSPMVVPSNEGGNGKNILIGINPIRLLHEMLAEAPEKKNPNGNNKKDSNKKNTTTGKPFRVRVVEYTKLSPGNMVFTVYREPARQEKRHNRGGVNVPKLIKQTYGPGNYRNKNNNYKR